MNRRRDCSFCILFYRAFLLFAFFRKGISNKKERERERERIVLNSVGNKISIICFFHLSE